MPRSVAPDLRSMRGSVCRSAPFITSTSHRRCAKGSAAGSSLRLQAARMTLPLCVFRNIPGRRHELKFEGYAVPETFDAPAKLPLICT